MNKDTNKNQLVEQWARSTLHPAQPEITTHDDDCESTKSFGSQCSGMKRKATADLTKQMEVISLTTSEPETMCESATDSEYTPATKKKVRKKAKGKPAATSSSEVSSSDETTKGKRAKHPTATNTKKKKQATKESQREAEMKEPCTPREAGQRLNKVLKAMDEAELVRSKSKNLKGDMSGRLRLAINTTRQVANYLKASFDAMTDEVLERATMAGIRQEIQELRLEVAALRAEKSAEGARQPVNSPKGPPASVPLTPLGNNPPGAKPRILSNVRVVPPRPPLQHTAAAPTKQRTPATRESGPTNAAQPQPQQPPAQAGWRPQRQTRPPQEPAKYDQETTNDPQLAMLNIIWTEMGKIKQAIGMQTNTMGNQPSLTYAEAAARRPTNARRAQAEPTPRTRLQVTAPKPNPKPRPKRTAAVHLNFERSETTYTEAMSLLRARINLDAYGVNKVRVAPARTGGHIIEFPQSQLDRAGAQKLATEIRDLLPDDVRVSCPVQMGTVRVTGFDESVTDTDLRAAIRQTTDLTDDNDISVGRMAFTKGLGATIIKCPIAAAIRLEENGRLRVGWTSARVRLLPPRGLQCHKCWQYGHAKIDCTSAADRSNACFRCGADGHRAASCTLEPRCPLCPPEENGHRAGSATCATAKTQSKPRKSTKKRAIANTGSEPGIEGSAPTGRMEVAK